MMKHLQRLISSIVWRVPLCCDFCALVCLIISHFKLYSQFLSLQKSKDRSVKMIASRVDSLENEMGKRRKTNLRFERHERWCQMKIKNLRVFHKVLKVKWNFKNYLCKKFETSPILYRTYFYFFCLRKYFVRLISNSTLTILNFHKS